MGVAVTEEGLGRGGWPAAPSSPSCSTPCSNPHRASRAISQPAGACHLLTPLYAWSHILLFPERAVGDGGTCLLSPAFVWAPDSQEPWPHLPPAGTPLSLAQYWAQSKPSAETPGIGLMSLSPEPSEICHIRAEKSFSINGGERRGSLRERQGVQGTHRQEGSQVCIGQSLTPCCGQVSLSEPPFPQQNLWSCQGG